MFLFNCVLIKILACNINKSVGGKSVFSLHKEALDLIHKFRKKEFVFKKQTLNPEIILNRKEYSSVFCNEKLSKYNKIVKLFIKLESLEDYNYIEQRFQEYKVTSYYDFYTMVFFYVLKELRIKNLADVKRLLFSYIGNHVKKSNNFRKFVFFGNKYVLEKIIKCFLNELISKNNILKIKDSFLLRYCTELKNNVEVINIIKLFDLHRKTIDMIYIKPLEIRTVAYFPSIYKFLVSIKNKEGIFNGAELLLLINEKILSSKDFKNLLKFDKVFILIKSTLRESNKYNFPIKKIHYLLNIILFNFKAVVYVLFGSENLLFQQKYIPKYKLVILQNLKIKLTYFLYLIFTKKKKSNNEHKNSYLLQPLLISFLCNSNNLHNTSSEEKATDSFDKIIDFLMKEHSK